MNQRTRIPVDAPNIDTNRDPVRLGDVLKDVMHILGGDTCREFLGHNQGYCGAPSEPGVGLCAKHRLDRAEWEYDMRTRQEG